MSLNMKVSERFQDTSAIGRRLTNKPLTKFPPLENRFTKRKSSNCLGSSDELFKGNGSESDRTASQKHLQRRATMNCLTPSVSLTAGKPRFFALGNKVKNLVKCKLAFQMKPKSNNDGGTDRTNTMEAIHKMPAAARFSSFLSPEAQYSMMKGYEDVLRNQLVQSNPEYSTILVRNKTPMNRIGIRKQTSGAGNLQTTNEADDKSVFYSDDEAEQESDEQSDQDVDWHPEAGHGKFESKNVTRRPSLPSSRNTVSRNSPSRCLKRTRSLQVIPHDRRLVMTYRLESAMDILDTIRHKRGMVPLSPRVVQESRKITPVTDYNSWATVWCKEFKVKA